MTDTAYPITQTSQAECPVHNDRRVSASQSMPQSRVEIDANGVWHISGFDEARQILRHEFTKQAGFRAEEIGKRMSALVRRQPILFLEGEEHHRLRRETNKFFTPSITDKQYQGFMNQFADDLVARLKARGRMDLRELTMDMAMRVASQVVGLTSSMVPGIRSRLEGLLNVNNVPQTVKSNRLYQIFAQRFVLGFLYLDVKPAIRARRKAPQNDVISYLLTRSYSDLEILTECIVYGVAGMATTREFILTALWHLMEKPHLRQRMLVGEQEERYAILHEILRLEPIVGHLFRRTTHEFSFVSAGQTMTVPAGTRIDINVFATNADPHMTGDNGLEVCPARSMTSSQGKVPEPVMSFGDGYHRCPGAYIAIQETDIFLRKLLAIETLKIEKLPDVVYNETVSGYEVNNFIVSV